MTTELSPCRYCGGKAKLTVGFDIPFNGQSFVDCLVCGIQTKIHDTEAEAIAAWERRPVSWEPKFDAMSHEQEQLAIKFCEQIGGRKGEKSSLPDPVRLLEMAEALYLAERNDTYPAPVVADLISN